MEELERVTEEGNASLHHDEGQIQETLRQARNAEQASDYPAAIATAQKAIELAQAAQDVRSETMGHLLHGQALRLQGENELAKLAYEQALDLAQEAGLRQLEADSLRSIGMLRFLQGDYVGARPYLGRALAIKRQLGDLQGESDLLNDLGIVFRRQGDYARAKSYLEQALSIVREFGDQRRESRALGNLGTAYLNLGDYPQAKTLYEQSLRLVRAVGPRSDESFRWYNLGLLSHLVGDNETAQEYCRQALEIAQDIGGRDVEGYALTGLGHALMELEQIEEASDAYRRAVEVRRDINQFHLAMESLAGLARVHFAQGALAEAQTQVEEILTYLEEHTLDGTEEPARVYLTCYQILLANQDPRAGAILNTVHHLLQKRASRINDEAMSHSFLENVAAHQQVLAELAEQRIGPVSPDGVVMVAGKERREADDEQKTRSQLVAELATARHRISELESLAAALRQAEQAAWEGETRFQSIAETASEAIIIFDIYENIFFWNRAAQNIFGYQAEETRGRLLASILSQEFHGKLQREIERVIATEKSDLLGETFEVLGIRKDGGEFPLELSVGIWETKEETFFTAIGRDVTERKQAEAALQRAYAEVEKQVQERTAELEREIAARERLQQEVIEAQRRAIQELSTPIIPVMDRIIIMPLIGSIDSLRARDIMRTLLAGIREYQADVVILDITGVVIVDTGVANHLNKTIQAARLKGAHTIVTGVSDAVAETIVDLGIGWDEFETLTDLRSGLIVALNRLGFRLTKARVGKIET